MKNKFYMSLLGIIAITFTIQATDPVIYLPFSGDLVNYGSNKSTFGSATATNASNGQPISFETVPGQYNCAIFPAATIADTSSVVLTGYKGILGSNARSISFWIKTTITSTNNKLITWGDRSGGNYKKWCVRLEDAGRIGAVRVEMTGNYITGTTLVNDGNWHHVAISYAAGGTLGTTKIYIDGIQDVFSAQNSGSVPNTTSKSDLAIGRENIGYNVANSTICYFNGKLSKVKIWDVAISAAEVATDYSETPGLVYTTELPNTQKDLLISTGHNSLTIDNKSSVNKTISVYNLNGLKIHHQILLPGTNIINLKPGAYITLIDGTGNQKLTRKIEVQ